MSKFLSTKTMNRNSRKKGRGVFLPLITLFAVFAIFQYSTVPERAALLLEPLYVRELTNTTLLTRFIREKLDTNTLTKEELVRALRLLEDEEKEFLLLQDRVRFLENEIPVEKLNEMDGTKTWVIHKASHNMFLIKGGGDKGFQEGDIVLSRLGEAIGYIADVFPKSSRVYLFSQSGLKSEGILSELNATIPLEGDGQNIISHLPRDMEVSDGNAVFLQCSPTTQIGSVTHIRFDPRDPEKIIIIQPTLAPSQIQTVMVLNGSEELCKKSFSEKEDDLF